MALSVPGLALQEGTVYTVFAMGLAGGEPVLEDIASVDNPAPAVLPPTGGRPLTSLLAPIALAFGALLLVGGLVLRARAAQI